MLIFILATTYLILLSVLSSPVPQTLTEHLLWGMWQHLAGGGEVTEMEKSSWTSGSSLPRVGRQRATQKSVISIMDEHNCLFSSLMQLQSPKLCLAHSKGYVLEEGVNKSLQIMDRGWWAEPSKVPWVLSLKGPIENQPKGKSMSMHDCPLSRGFEPLQCQSMTNSSLCPPGAYTL